MSEIDDDTSGRVTSEVGPWAMVPAWVLTKKLTPAELVTYIALRSFADRGGDAYPTSARIAERANLAKTTVRNAVQALRSKGLIETTERKRPDGSLAGLDYKMFDIDPAPGQSAQPRRVGDKGGRKTRSAPPTPTGAPPSTAGENTGAGYPTGAGGSAPTGAGDSTSWCTQEHTREHTSSEHTSVPASQVRRSGGEPETSSDDGQLLLGGGVEPFAGEKEPTNNDIAMGIARGWLHLREEAGCPVVVRRKADPLMALRNVVLPALESGYTDREIKWALMRVDRAMPTPDMLDTALTAVRRGWRPVAGWMPGDAQQHRPVGRQRNGTGPMAGTNQHIDDLTPEERQARNPFAGAARQSDYVDRRGAVA